MKHERANFNVHGKLDISNIVILQHMFPLSNLTHWAVLTDIGVSELAHFSLLCGPDQSYPTLRLIGTTWIKLNTMC